MCHQVRPLMPRCCSMQCGWLGRDRNSGPSPVIRFVDLGDSPRESPIFKGVSFLTAGHAPAAALCHHRNANQKAAAKALGHFGKVAADHAAPKEQRAVDIVSGKV